MIEILKGILCIYILYIIIAAIWIITEKEIYGQITPRIIDDIVAIILAVSLYFNMKQEENEIIELIKIILMGLWIDIKDFFSDWDEL